ncbi:hypothetical protein Agub_g1337 [Astrephomene gubernaculifera]|uniref:F-box domain-containing protein n=1 Tax=Astrephomene gubernaculifera TaxID=47775 RepID=A0AAD3HHE2_9CHLO|nr:hypothetical protein Agub_g1337 [Astrephomene gubernaculifera]
MAMMQDERPAKRARSLEAIDMVMTQLADSEEARSLLSLPDGVLHHIMGKLPASSLLALGSVCRYFRNRDPTSGLLLTHRFAKDNLTRMVGREQAERWRNYNWIRRLEIEETLTEFDRDRSAQQQFTFKEAGSGVVTEVSLNEPGPRMLLSNTSTAESPILRWKLQLRGNNAAEDTSKALHKCLPNPAGERATGFSSAITVGSLLPARLPVMRGTVVEILVTPREVSFIVLNPEDGKEMIWQNNSTVPRKYTGPRELRLQLPCNYTGPVKLAVTAWQRAAFGVLHSSPAEEPRQQDQRPGEGARQEDAAAGQGQPR